MPATPRVFSVNTFTNPNGDRVAQAFIGGMPFTREFPADACDAVVEAARVAYEECIGAARLETWNVEDGSVVVEQKP